MYVLPSVHAYNCTRKNGLEKTVVANMREGTQKVQCEVDVDGRFTQVTNDGEMRHSNKTDAEYWKTFFPKASQELTKAPMQGE